MRRSCGDAARGCCIARGSSCGGRAVALDHWLRRPLAARPTAGQVTLEVAAGAACARCCARTRASGSSSATAPSMVPALLPPGKAWRRSGIKAGRVSHRAGPASRGHAAASWWRARVVLHSLTIVEGWTFASCARRSARRVRHCRRDHGTLPTRRSCARSASRSMPAEGLFFPDTYRFAPGSTSDLEILRLARERSAELRGGLGSRAPDLPLAKDATRR